MAEIEDLVTLLREETFDPTPLSALVFRFSCISGPDTGLEFHVTGAEPAALRIGTSPASDVKLTDPQVSRRHAQAELVGTRIVLSDLGSTNGTHVDGVAIGEAYLNGGEQVRFGQDVFQLERPARKNAPPPPAVTHFGRVIGASTEMRKLYPVFERLAASSIPVIIEGETGTGKELVAEALHENGPRADKPFVVLDCSAIAPNIIESELFGHERGAFTGAVGTRKGLMELADGGTLFIDEIGELDAGLQPKLLRALERKEFRRVGGNAWLGADVRVIAATNRDLDLEVQERRFREDLFHRLAVGRVELPPLRRRRGDIPILVRFFLKHLGADPGMLPTALVRRWDKQAWPGNIRELKNSVERSVALGVDLAEQFSEAAGAPESPALPSAAGDLIEHVLSLGLPLGNAREMVTGEFERRYLERVLAEHGGNVGRAAAAAGVARRYFQLLRARTRA